MDIKNIESHEEFEKIKKSKEFQKLNEILNDDEILQDVVFVNDSENIKIKDGLLFRTDERLLFLLGDDVSSINLSEVNSVSYVKGITQSLTIETNSEKTFKYDIYSSHGKEFQESLKQCFVTGAKSADVKITEKKSYKGWMVLVGICVGILVWAISGTEDVDKDSSEGRSVKNVSRLDQREEFDLISSWGDDFNADSVSVLYDNSPWVCGGVERCEACDEKFKLSHYVQFKQDEQSPNLTTVYLAEPELHRISSQSLEYIFSGKILYPANSEYEESTLEPSVKFASTLWAELSSSEAEVVKEVLFLHETQNSYNHLVKMWVDGEKKWEKPVPKGITVESAEKYSFEEIKLKFIRIDDRLDYATLTRVDNSFANSDQPQFLYFSNTFSCVSFNQNFDNFNKLVEEMDLKAKTND